jgi:ribosomal protein S18 acetylase RimI-like enzyme
LGLSDDEWVDVKKESLFVLPRVFQWERSEDFEVLARHLEQFSSIKPRINAERFLDVMGIPNGSKIDIFVEQTGSVTISAQHQDLGLELLQDAVINDDGQWQLVIHNLSIASSHRQQGLATQVLQFMAATAARHGFTKISLLAVRDIDKQGYWVWAVFGFDGFLETALKEIIVQQLKILGIPPIQAEQIKTVQDVLTFQGGDSIWQEFGDTRSLRLATK